MRWKAAKKGDVILYQLNGNMFTYEETLHDDLKNRLADGERRFVIDLGGVAHMSSLGLGTLIALRTSVDRESGRIVLCRPNQRIREVFMHVQLMRFFDCYAECTDAVASFENRTETKAVS